MTPRLLLEPEAEAEFLEAGRWYAERNPAIAAAFRVSVERTLEAVGRGPPQFPTPPRGGPKAMGGRLPFFVFYQVFFARYSGIAVIPRGRGAPRSEGPRRRPT